MKGMLNEVRMIGVVIKKPALKYHGNGTPVAMTTIGCRRGDAKGRMGGVDYFHVVTWDAVAEKLAAAEEGSVIMIVGRLQNHKFMDAEGNARTIPEIAVAELTVVGKTCE